MFVIVHYANAPKDFIYYFYSIDAFDIMRERFSYKHLLQNMGTYEFNEDEMSLTVKDISPKNYDYLYSMCDHVDCMCWNE